MFVYKNQKVSKSKTLRGSRVSLKATEQVVTSKKKSSKKNSVKKLTKRNKEFLKQLGFTLKEKKNE